MNGYYCVLCDVSVFFEDEQSSKKYSWHLVGVLDYRKEERQFLVQKVKQSSDQRDEDGNPIINKRWKKSTFPDGFFDRFLLSLSLLLLIMCVRSVTDVNSLQGGSKYWVPRIRLWFSAEDPRVFVERISFALRLREDAETQLMYDFSVDLMPIWKGNPSLSADSLQRIKRLALSSRSIPPEMSVKTSFCSCLVLFLCFFFFFF